METVCAVAVRQYRYFSGPVAWSLSQKYYFPLTPTCEVISTNVSITGKQEKNTWHLAAFYQWAGACGMCLQVSFYRERVLLLQAYPSRVQPASAG